MEERRERAVDMGVLAAGVAVIAGQFGAAVEAIPLVRVAVIGFAGLGLDRAADDSPGHRVAQCFEFAGHPIPLYRERHYAVLRPRASRSRHGPHRSPRRLVQPRAPGAPGDQPSCHANARARRSVVAGFARQPPEGGRQGHGAVRGAATRRRSGWRGERRIRVSDFETREGTKYTVDTVKRLKQRFPKNRFIWLMGADNLRHFHHWRDWRGLAREVPIAVIRRPGYDRQAHAVRAMGWLGRFVRPPNQAKCWTEWSAPAILLLRLPRDPSSATAIRAHSPDWHRKEQARARRAPYLAMPLSVRRPLDRTSR